MRRGPLVLICGALAGAALLARRARLAANPIVQPKYTADPAPLVHEDTLYLYTSHDEDDADGFTMYDYLLYSTKDLANWTDHGIVAGVREPHRTFAWSDGYNAWAPQVVARDGRVFLYVPTPKGGRMPIGVAVADQPTGPFVDAIGAPLIDNPASTYDIDPTVFVDTDGQAYLYWGHQPPLFYVELNRDMVSYSGDIVELPRVQTYEEGPWFWALDGRYYLAFASTCCPEGIGYAMSDAPTGPWTFMGSIMDGDPRSSGNHPGIVEYKGSWYVFGFSYELLWRRQTEHVERRSVSVERMEYAPDGTIPKLPFWSEEGPPQVETLDPFVRTEAETIAWAWEVRTEPSSAGGVNVTGIEDGDYIKVKGVDFGEGARSFAAAVASASDGGDIEVRLDGLTGTLVGTCSAPGTGGWQTWVEVSCPIEGATGVHDVYFVFTGGSGSLLSFDWWRFEPSVGEGTGGAGGALSSGGTGNEGGGIALGGVYATGGSIDAGGAVAETSGGTVDTDGSSGGTGGPAGPLGGSTGGIRGSGGAAGASSGQATGGLSGSGGLPSPSGGEGPGAWVNAGGTTSAGATGGVESSGGAPTPPGGVPTGTAVGMGGVTGGAAADDRAQDGGGCGCRTAGREGSFAGRAPLALLGLAALRRRRRRDGGGSACPCGGRVRRGDADRAPGRD